MVAQAGSGHLGMPLGCAEIMAYLYGHHLNFDPWERRDRFILSAGHGCAMLYSALHLTGFDVTIDDLKAFRQMGSRTPGHPELHCLPGVESTTGLDGHGLAHAVGQAFGSDARVITLVGDGCMMEGVGFEASSLAALHQLENLTIIYDSNQTCLDGYVSEVMCDNVAERYRSMGWKVAEIDGHDFDQIDRAMQKSGPLLIIASTQIGRGLESEGTPSAHRGIPKDSRAIRQTVGLPLEPFTLPDHCYVRRAPQIERVPTEITPLQLKVPAPGLSGRDASFELLQQIAQQDPTVICGSADLSQSTRCFIPNRNIKFGVREFAMGAIGIGLAQVGLRPILSTFLAFSDYMISAMRLAAMMKLPTTYILTHDSIAIGPDGPTHQPIDQLSILRGIPNLLTIRPADSQEITQAYLAAYRHQGPTALVLSKEALPPLPAKAQLDKGAYPLFGVENPEIILLATGSEVALACQLREILPFPTEVISFPSWELFEQQPIDYRRKILPPNALKVSIEAATTHGWRRYADHCIGIDTFGRSGSKEELLKHFGLSVDRLRSELIAVHRSHSGRRGSRLPC